MINRWTNGNPRGRLKLLCLPYAGGAASIFKAWPNLIDARVGVVPVRLPGREMRAAEAPIRNMEQLVDEIADGVADLTSQPYALFGHSMGALLAYELAALVIARGGRAPLHLFVSAAAPPHAPRQVVSEPARDMADDELVARVAEINSPLALIQDEELRRVFVAVFRADIEVCQSYRDRGHPKLPCPITALAGTADNGVGAEEIDGWRLATKNVFRLARIEGDHFFVHDGPAVSAEINRDLGRVADVLSLTRP